MITDVQVWPITDDMDLEEVKHAGLSDGEKHLIAPTHFVTKGGQVIGAFCLTSPTVYWWMHSQKASMKDSLLAYQSLDALMRHNRIDRYIMPCEPTSPYYKLLNNRCNVLKSADGQDSTLFVNK